MPDPSSEDDPVAAAPSAAGDDPHLPGAKTGVSLLSALFVESDTVLLRPIETWNENGKKRSHVHFNRIGYPTAAPKILGPSLLNQVRFSERERTNVFFGVCPRFGGGGKFDLAWQIRTVRTLWTDLDNITVTDAMEKIEKAKLPRPSAAVGTGHGLHAYWLLEDAYLIDDVGDPAPVHIEWRTDAHGKKKPHKYLLEDGERVFLEQRPLVAQLSPKSLAIQNTLAGIAQAIGGDHTTDLARLLRVPGTKNRKDQRNGKEPVATVLVECERYRRYPLAAFDAFKRLAPESKRAQQIALMPLPKLRKLSPTKGDKLADRIAACVVADVGNRSEADFAVCCYAVRHGVAKEELWPQLEGVGKFAERGRGYFDVTWQNAEHRVRLDVLDHAERGQRKVAPQVTPERDAGSGESREINGDGFHAGDDLPSEGGRRIIEVDTSNTPVASTLGCITTELLQAGSYFIRTDQLVDIRDEQIKPVLSAAELAGQLSQHAEVFFVEDGEGDFRPLPVNYGNTWLNNHSERRRLPAIKLFTRNPVFAEDLRLVKPGFDAASGVYYAGPAIEPSLETTHLDALLADFCFQRSGDRTNYIGVLLTAILILRFIGSKPAALFNGNQAGLGKSILAQVIAILRDGKNAETATYNPNDEEFEKRLGAIVRSGDTTIIVDNAKARGRSPRIDSPCLERSITDPILSFRLLGESASIRAENSHIIAITANSAEVSRDLLTRSIVINLLHEGDPARRTFQIADPEGYALEHRSEILGELLGMVERWKTAGMPRASTKSRFNKRGWGDIVGGILDVCDEPGFLDNADDAAMAMDETRRDFAELVALLVDHPQGQLPPSGLVDLCSEHSLLVADLGDGSRRSMATRMGTLAGRFVNEQFNLADGRLAIFKKKPERKGNVYRAQVEAESPNLPNPREPSFGQGSAQSSAESTGTCDEVPNVAEPFK